ncbi:hypothetical protein PT277_00245 [Acetobacteraceae bacterium ESL0709]|nr:hypothetical protein [Acetobacteraceae bacterium ESL0709]
MALQRSFRTYTELGVLQPAFYDALAEEEGKTAQNCVFAMIRDFLITTRRTPIPVIRAAYGRSKMIISQENRQGSLMVLRDFTTTTYCRRS